MAQPLVSSLLARPLRGLKTSIRKPSHIFPPVLLERSTCCKSTRKPRNSKTNTSMVYHQYAVKNQLAPCDQTCIFIKRYCFYVSVLNRIGCCWEKRRRSATLGSPVPSTFGAENPGALPDGNDVELGGAEKKSQDKVGRPEFQRPSTAQSIVIVREEDENQETWKEIARALDRVFFWLFLALFVVSTLVVYGQSGRLKSFDSFDD